MPDSLLPSKSFFPTRPLRTYEGIWVKLRSEKKVVLEVVNSGFIPRVKRMISKEKDMDIGFKMLHNEEFTIKFWEDRVKRELTILLLSNSDILAMSSFFSLMKQELIRRYVVATPATDSTVTMAMDNVEQVRGKILALQRALQEQLPEYESHLHIIHRNLATDPNTVHLLTDEEIGIICAGLSKKTGVMIAKENADKLVNKKKAKIGVEDL